MRNVIMKRFAMMFALVALLAGNLVAQEKEAGCQAGACPGQTELVSTQDGVQNGTTTADEAVCPITEGMKLLPVIHYWVGDEEACCAGSAAALAKGKELPITYKVGESSFETEEAAFANLVEATEAFVNAFAAPQTCPVSGQTYVAGEACKCEDSAAQRVELVRKAMDEVVMTYKVGTETCNCPLKAKDMASKAGTDVVFVVTNQETTQETPCEHTARLNLAKAKYKAALLAINAATSTPETVPAQTLTTETIK
jgi:hypothetical protein